LKPASGAAFRKIAKKSGAIFGTVHTLYIKIKNNNNKKKEELRSFF
jgi:hypothetical protein